MNIDENKSHYASSSCKLSATNCENNDSTEYEFIKTLTKSYEPYNWFGKSYMPHNITKISFDINFKNNVPLQDGKFGIKTHSPIITNFLWLEKCKPNEYIHIELNLSLNPEKQMIIFIADDYLDNLEFKIKNFKITDTNNVTKQDLINQHYIKIYIVTYKNEDLLDKCLESLFNSDLMEYRHEINVINNFGILEAKNNKYKILNNVCRPDNSTGHLARNWNQALLNGFVNLNTPQCSILVCCQNDTEFQKKWCSQLIASHFIYDFITMGAGDEFHSYTPNAIKKIGIWDERFCSIEYQEGDYFLRALIYNNNKSSINDEYHSRVHNPIPNTILNKTTCGYMRGDDEHMKAMTHRAVSRTMFITKWGIDILKCNHNWKEISKVPNGPLIPTYMYYPYFEFGIDNLSKLRYIL